MADFEEPEIQCHDSRGAVGTLEGPHQQTHQLAVDSFARWLTDDYRDKHGTPPPARHDAARFQRMYNPAHMPRQPKGNYRDCGNFMVLYASCKGAGRPFDFDARNDEGYFRAIVALQRRHMTLRPQSGVPHAPATALGPPDVVMA